MKAPRLARIWVRAVAPAHLRHGILDDLDEIARSQPTPSAAYRAYWRETLRGTPQLIRLRLEASTRVLSPETLLRDARLGLRSLWREPTFALTATLTLALGIGATTTVFSVVDAELWKPLPFQNPHELVKISSRLGSRNVPISGAELIDWRDGLPAFSEIAADGSVSRQTMQLDTAQSVAVSHVTGNYFDVLPRRVLAGRTFSGADVRGTTPAVITDRAWRRLFDASPATVGRSILLDGRAIDVVGIVQANDSMGGDAELFLPVDERAPAFHDRSQTLFFGAIARLRPGADLSLASTQAAAVNGRLLATHPVEQAGKAIEVQDLNAFYTASGGRTLYFLLGASMVVLLLSVVNVAGLVLARGFGRRRELALRRALGGGRLALARQQLAEGAWLALPAGFLGVLVAHWAVRALAAQLPDEVLLRGAEIPVDARVWLCGFATAGATAVCFTLAPLWAARRLDLSSALAAGARTGRPASEGRARAVLLIAQISLTLVLVAGAAIFLKSFLALSRVPLGFDPDQVLSIRAPLGGPRYAADAAVHEYAGRLLATAAAIPGVRDVAIATSSPLGSGPIVNFLIPDRARPTAGSEPRAIIRAVTPEYFRTLGIALRRGRAFTDADSTDAPRVAIVNEHVASQIAGTDGTVGRTIDLLGSPRAVAWTRKPGALEIVGVAANAKEFGPNEALFGGVYVPIAQMTPVSLELIARAAVPPSTIAGELRRRVAALDAAVPVGAVSTFEQRVQRALRPDRFNLLLVAGFAAAGLLLACVGIYGAVAYAIQTRTRELGVRLALGARPSRLVSDVVGRALRLGVIGGAAGLAVALVLARLIGDAWYLVPGSHNGLLFGVTTTDPWMLASAFVGMAVVTVIAAAIPARRIARLDPVRALRTE